MATSSSKKISKIRAKHRAWLLGASLIFLTHGMALADDTFNSTVDAATIGTLQEYTADYSKAQIYASSAYLRGFTGSGQVVAVFDSGVDRTNTDLTGQVLAGYDALTGTVGVTNDNMGHGTFVTGVVAAASNGTGVEGVAFNSKVYPVQVINAAGSVATTDGQMATGIAYAINNNAHIFNNSWNSTTTIVQTNAYSLNYTMPATLWLMKYAVSIGDVFVFAAGNSSAAEPGYMAALPNLFPYLKNGYLSVVATDSTGALASYSNACGSTAAYCLAAPGTNILSTYGSGNGLGMGSGTSFAAPVVSAALAILLQEFPYLKASDAAKILLQTATKTGIYANTAVYGQGLLNLNAATNPVGTVSIPATTSVNGIQVAAASSGTMGSRNASQSWAKEIGPILVLDSYNRGYQVNASTLVASPTHTLDTRQVTTQYGFGDMPEIAPGMYGFSTSNQFTGDQQSRFAIKNKNGVQVEASLGTDPAYGFGNFADGTLPAGSLVVADGAANPYLNLADQAGAAHVAMPVQTGSGTLHLSATMFSGDARTPDLTAQLTDPSYAPPSVTGGAAEIAGTLDAINTHVSLNFGGVREDGRLLGSSSSGAFGSTNHTDTYFTGLDVSMKLSDNLHLVGGYEMGQSHVSQSASAFNTQYGTIQSESFHAGLVEDAVFSAKDKLGIIFSEPMRVTSGNASVTVPTARDFYGNIVTSSQTLSTADNGQELNLQGFYSYHQTEHSSIDAGVLVRFQPDNNPAAATETIGIMRWTDKF